MTQQQFSLLSGEEIQLAGVIHNAQDRLLRASTYDLSVGDIIPADGQVWDGPRYSLPPGGMVRVVSKEVLAMPETLTGHVLLKNELCTRGVLAINIGVVDPGFEGPLSSTLINFGRQSCVIEKGTPYLRVSFHRCAPSPRMKRVKYDRDSYIKRVQQEVQAYSGETFLNIDNLTARAAERAFISFREGLVVWATLVAVIVAVLAIFAPLGASLVDKYLSVTESHVEQKIDAKYEERFKAISEQIGKSQQQGVNSQGGHPQKGNH